MGRRMEMGYDAKETEEVESPAYICTEDRSGETRRLHTDDPYCQLHRSTPGRQPQARGGSRAVLYVEWMVISFEAGVGDRGV